MEAGEGKSKKKKRNNQNSSSTECLRLREFFDTDSSEGIRIQKRGNKVKKTLIITWVELIIRISKRAVKGGMHPWINKIIAKKIFIWKIIIVGGGTQ